MTSRAITKPAAVVVSETTRQKIKPSTEVCNRGDDELITLIISLSGRTITVSYSPEEALVMASQMRDMAMGNLEEM